MPDTGVLKWLNEILGYGFIQREDADDLFVHYSVIQNDAEQTLEEGDVVEFDVADGAKGPMASKCCENVSFALVAQLDRATDS